MESRLDFSSSPELNHPFFEVFCIGFMAFAWSIFILSTKNYANVFWYEWLFYSRLAMSLTGIILIYLIISKKLYSLNLSSWYLLASVGIQASHGLLEGNNSVEFYNFIGIIFVLGCLSYNGPLRNWLKTQLPFYILFFTVPLFFKNPKFFSNIGTFIDSYSLMVSGLIIGVGILKITSSRYSYILKYLETKEDIVKLAYQVAHDIRSPVTALKIALNETSLENTEKEIVFYSLSRIEDIASDLLTQHKKTGSMPLSPFIIELERLIDEKKIIFGNKTSFSTNFEINHRSLYFAKSQSELIRVISNLINNSAESMNSRYGTVLIETTQNESDFLIKIKDTGKGIPSVVLDKLKANSFTFNKISGNGIGLKHAREFLKNLNGELCIDSEINIGTEVILKIPTSAFI